MTLVEEMAQAMYESEREETGVGRPWARLMTSAKARWMRRAEAACSVIKPRWRFVGVDENRVPIWEET